MSKLKALIDILLIVMILVLLFLLAKIIFLYSKNRLFYLVAFVIITVIARILVSKKSTKKFLKEKLLTYETLILFIFVVILLGSVFYAVQYFSVVEDGRDYVTSCFASQGFECLSKPYVTNNNITFYVANKIGYSVTLSNAALSPSLIDLGCNGPYLCPKNTLCTDTARTINDEGNATFVELYNNATLVILNGCNFSALVNNNMIKGEVKFKYINSVSGMEENAIFSFIGKVKR